MPKGKMFLLAVLAGLFIAVAGVGSLIGSTVAGKLAGACIFPAGLAMVILAGSELFTGNNLMVISLLEKKITVSQLLTAWLVVYAGNLVGAMLVAWLAVAGGTFGAYYEALIAAAAAKTSLAFEEAVLRGILCNVLVCVAVWMAMAAKEPAGKVLGLFFPIMVFVLCGFEHCVANMFYIPAGLMASARYGVTAEGLTWGTFLGRNLLPVTIGNIIGGGGLGVLFWAIHLRKK
jgi:formate/nitrite transporter